jgi:hypothetical protein
MSLLTVGQKVLVESSLYSSNTPQAASHITALLPDTTQYRVRSDGERHDRIVDEDSLEEAGTRPLLSGASSAEPARFPSRDRAAASRPQSHERLEYARRRESDCDGALRRIRQLVEDNRLL